MIPWTISPWASLNLGAAMFELGQMCKSVPLEAPWEAKKAQKWDRMTLAQWLDRNVMSKAAHDLLDTAISGCYTSAASEVSMLFMLYQMGSAGGPNFVLGGKGASQDARVVGGMGAIYRPMAAELGDAIQLSQPVRYITQDADGVTVRTEGDSVRARRVIVAVPLAIASQIIYEPMLPTDRSFLHQRMPSGSIVKISIVYDEPFWRADGLCGQSAAPGSLATVTIDACTDTGAPGILCVIIEGPIARQYERLEEGERRQGVLDALVARFGAKAGKPVEYHEQNWTREPYSGGGMLSHAPPGVLTEFGHALRTPCGRVHWAGTETSTKMCGWIDGAIRSGERAATEVMASEALTGTNSQH
jgi:monoamine oxidase